ncbi:hypothetical protein C8J56DRAFT_920848 [Mycena floridula]|nr:hypothetical protein C8J56DRAFT_920848 [Mycena floridula]
MEKPSQQATMDGPASLPNLGLDLLINIQYFIEPKDILSLRKVCKSITESTKIRVVWIAALQNLCDKFKIFAPSFPIKELSLKELEYLATCEYRFRNRLKTELDAVNSHVLSPVCTRLLQISPQNYPQHDIGEFDEACLVPGGRYLLTVTDTGLLQVWDLGFSPDAMIQSIPIATLIVEDIECSWRICAQPTPNAQGLTILVPHQPSANSCFTFDIYHIMPQAANPRFHRLATLKYGPVHLRHSDAAGLGLSSIHLGFWTLLGGLVVWNFYQDTWLTWHLPPSVELVVDIMISEQNIVVIGNTEVLIYALPALQPRVPGDTLGTISPQTVLLKLSISTEIAHDANICSDFAWAWPETFWGFSTINRDSGELKLSHYVLHELTASSKAGPLSLLPVQVSTSVLHNLPSVEDFQDTLSLGDSHRLVCYELNGMLWARLSDLSNETSESFGPLYDKRNNACRSTMCPIVGRLAIWEGKEVRIMDYVAPPCQFERRERAVTRIDIYHG